MPMVEYKCPKCELVVEQFQTSWKTRRIICEGKTEVHNAFEMDRVEFSVPAKRNPRYGEG
jgi:hypothetical protein